MKFVIFLIATAISFSAFSTPQEEARVYFYYMKGVVDGGKPFAKAITEFKKAVDENRSANGEGAGLLTYTNTIMEDFPKTGEAPGSSSIYSDIKTFFSAGFPKAAKRLPLIEAYFLAAKYLTSGNLKSPRYYEQLAATSEEDLAAIKSSIQYFVSQNNAGLLTEEEKKMFDQLMRYYTGASIFMSDEEIMQDTLMMPLARSGEQIEDLRMALEKNLSDFSKTQKSRYENLKNLMELREQSANLREISDKIQSSNSFVEIDALVEQLQQQSCVPVTYDVCEKFKKDIQTQAEIQKQRIVENERAEAIDQTIQVGIALSQLTGDENLGKAFRALDAVNKAFIGVDKAITMYGVANTAWGTVAAFSTGFSSVMFAAVAIGALNDSGGGDGAVLAALEEIRQLLVQVRQEMLQNFDEVKKNQARMENVLSSYDRITNNNLGAIAAKLDDFSSQILENQRPFQTAEITYRQGAQAELKALRQQFNDFLFMPPNLDQNQLNQSLRTLFAGLSTIVEFVSNGEYLIGLSGKAAIDNFAGLFGSLAGYNDDRFRSAFLLQTLINTSALSQCQNINLLGYAVASTASEEVNRVLDLFTQQQIAAFLKTGINPIAFFKSMKSNAEYLNSQRTKITACLGDLKEGLSGELENARFSGMSALLNGSMDELFGNPDRLNDFLKADQRIFETFNPLGGFFPEAFRIGNLIANTKSLDPQIWAENQPDVHVHRPLFEGEDPGFYLKRSHLEQLITNPLLRLAFPAGLGYGFEFIVYDDHPARSNTSPGGPLKQAGQTNFNIVLLQLNEMKPVHIWSGYFISESVKDYYVESTYDKKVYDIYGTDSPNKNIAIGSAAAVYEISSEMTSPGDEFISSIKHINRPDWRCIDRYGVLECISSENNALSTPMFVQPTSEYPLWRVGKDFPLMKRVGNMDVRLTGPNSFDSFITTFLRENVEPEVNPRLKEFSERTLGFINPLIQHTAQSLSQCLMMMIVEGQCQVEGKTLIANPAQTSWDYIDNMEMMSAVLAAYLGDTKRLQTLSGSSVDRLQLSYPTAEEFAVNPNAFVLRLNEEVARLKFSNASSVEVGAMELPDEIISNDFFRLYDRLEALR